MEGRLNRIAKKLLLKSLAGARNCRIEIVCPETTYLFGDPGHSLRATIAVHNEAFFSRALFGGDIGVGESYMDGDWSSPDLVSVIRVATRNMVSLDSGNRLLTFGKRFAEWLRHLRRDNTILGSKKNIAYHYDLGNDFYRIFLDPTMAYSCAIYDSVDDTLEQAQLRKFEHICRKLDLHPQDHLLEIGTGWGGFAAYAARHYGCRITTTTISRQQFEYSDELFEPLRANGHRIELLFEDYRDLTGQYDKIVSIEMFEAVGYKHYDEFFSACNRLLRPEGIMLIQSITMNEKHFAGYLKQSDWIKKYIFPGAELASVRGVIESLARTGQLQLAHLEDIGTHYAQTLQAWRLTVMDRAQDVYNLKFDEKFLRMWEFYLAYCEGGFRERYIGDVQLLLAKPASPRLFHEPIAASLAQPAISNYT